MESKMRSVARTVDAREAREGAGFLVHRPFPAPGFEEFDPFLLLDEMGPEDLAPGMAQGAPDHPHRGFETVTYMLSGEMEHRDSAGHAGRLTPGDVQWMTAGDGVVHSEMPSKAFLRDGGRMHGFQLWVNLPRRDKRAKPRYQEFPGAKIPTGKSADGKVSVKVIAGEALGARAVIETRTPIVYQHYTVQPGGKVVQPLGRDYNAFAYVFEGKGTFGPMETPARKGQAVLFSRDGDSVAAAAGDEPLQFLLVAGVPLNEPVVRYGPFVMNTKREIQEAFADYQSGRMGAIPS